MNIFLTPVMHEATARDFSIIEKSLRRTRQSLMAQTDQSFLWVIVCNTPPQIGDPHENIVFHQVDFPPADSEQLRSKMADKGAKLVSGLLFIHQFHPTYVYYLDADDWLNTDLNEYLNKHDVETAGWHADAGYLSDIDTRRTQKKFRLDRFCGSTFAANYSTMMDILDIEKNLDADSGKDKILETLPWMIIENVFFSHDHDTFFRAHGLSPKRLGLDAVCWVRGTGENIWVDGASRRLERGLQLSGRQLDRFGIKDPTITSSTPNTLRDYFDYALIALRSLVGSFFKKNPRYIPD